MSIYYGDFTPGQKIYVEFNSVNTLANPSTLINGAVTVCRNGADVTPSGGVTLAVDLDTVIGRNRVTIDMSVDPATFTTGAEYAVRLSGASSVAGISVIGVTLAEWSIDNRAAGIGSDPWVTALPGAYGAGTAGNIVGTNLDARVSTRSVFAAGGSVVLDLTQAVPTSNTPGTVGEAFSAARAQGFGKWALDRTTRVLTLYAPDGVTIIKTLTFDSILLPSVRQ